MFLICCNFTDFVVMENVFPADLQPNEMYDLKVEREKRGNVKCTKCVEMYCSQMFCGFFCLSFKYQLAY